MVNDAGAVRQRLAAHPFPTLTPLTPSSLRAPLRSTRSRVGGVVGGGLRTSICSSLASSFSILTSSGLDASMSLSMDCSNAFSSAMQSAISVPGYLGNTIPAAHHNPQSTIHNNSSR